MNASSITIEWNHLNGEQYQKLMQGTHCAYQQHWAYGEVVNQFGGHTMRGVLYQGDTPIACIQIQKRPIMKWLSIAIAMRGPVWLNDTISDETKAACYRLIKTQHNIRWPYVMLLMPEADDTTALAAEKLRRVVSGYGTVLIDLTQDEEALLAQLDGKWRNQLRGAQKKDIQCSKVSLKPESYNWLLDEEAKQRKRIGYAALSPALVPYYQLMAGKDSLLILRATSGTQTIAGVLCLVHNNCATYHIGWSNEEGKQSAAHNLLLWEAMLQLKARGITQFDLGGINTDDAAGIARFKIGTGGKVVQLCGTYM